ncbi:S66 peptidase family protein [Actinocatenispora thailandica]|uniref:S66 peptidase family protein n=1 Tax=Actinocatenispora thailandica TaxID=227318 RepID=UPI0019506F89|nr:LD-carboxypeptidase [Actinocatenispora thailandica]
MPDDSLPLKPAPLNPGDQVVLISPAGPVAPEHVERGAALLREWGLSVTIGAHAYDRDGLVAGTDNDRLADLNTALADPAIRAVLCTRGGYGSQRIVGGIDTALVRRDPKIVLGFSDITALHLALWRGARLATLHGPALSLRTEPDPVTRAALRAALFDPTPVRVVAEPAEPTTAVTTSGCARGRLLGGNLAMLAATAGTPDAPDLAGAVLLLEDIAEPAYKVDRMVLQLERAGLLTDLAGVAVGQFTDCPAGHPSVPEVLADRLHRLGVPVLGGLPIGHGAVRVTVPLGTRAVLDADAGTLTVDPALRRP